ncbi:endo alpha-1,4 polygalactosaminidase [Vibrio fluvialis]|nr:endo alpha-1,4 polygalactosaminidase [Vibrio fluvialis]ELU8400420.1 endo alpha-1,4 polygalactosaminidase [Vibrio fluvialis]
MKKVIPKNVELLILSASLIIGITACNADTENKSTTTAEKNDASWNVPVGLNWMWQLQNYDNLEIHPDVDVYDVDLFEASIGGQQSVIRKLKAKNKKVICYFSAGTRESWRDDAGDFSEKSVIYDGGMKDWPGEVWLDISNTDELEHNIKPIMIRRLELAVDSGCDGVEPDNVDAFNNIEETHGLISQEVQLQYNRWLSMAAHQRGLSIGLKNDFQQLAQLVGDYDFAVSEQCYAYGIQCADYESTFLAQGKAVFNQEYYTDGQAGEIDETTFMYSACAYYKSVGISSLWKEGYQLDGMRVKSCQ